MKLKDVKTRLGVSGQTVRNWGQSFSEHLSPGANPGQARTRQFSEDDLRVLAAVKVLKGEGLSDDDIHLALASGQLPELEELRPEVQESRALAPYDFFEEYRRLQDRIAELEHQVGYLEGKLEGRKSLWQRIRSR